MKHITIKCPPYPIKIHVCTLDFPIIKKVDIDPDLADFDTANEAETLPGRCKKTGAHVVIMRLPLHYDEETTWHECIHAAADILDIVGAAFTADSMDTVIYPCEHLVKQVKAKFYGLKVDRS